MKADVLRLASRLDEMASNLGRWADRTGDARKAADKAIRDLREGVKRVDRSSSTLTNRAADVTTEMQELAGSTSADLERTVQRCAEVEETRSQSMRLQDLVAEQRDQWEQRLDQARDALREATRWLTAAQAEQQACSHRFAAAQHQLRAAESALQSCNRDQNRSDCRGEANRVSAAGQDVQRAAMDLRQAEEQVRVGLQQVAAAQEYVSCCDEALESVTQADGLAVGARQIAQTAHDEAKVAHDAMQRATTLATKQVERAVMAESHAERTADLARKSNAELLQADAAHAKAKAALDQARRHAVSGRRDISRSATKLKQLARTRL